MDKSEVNEKNNFSVIRIDLKLSLFYTPKGILIIQILEVGPPSSFLPIGQLAIWRLRKEEGREKKKRGVEAIEALYRAIDREW